jgi:hypothetical protein
MVPGHAHTAQVAIETYSTDNNGGYAGATPAAIHGIETTIQLGPGNNNAFIAANGVTATAGAYTVTATAANRTDRFSIARAANGSLSRTCLPVGQVGCSASGAW